MRYFLEVSYQGTNYAGFQVQKNANTIQAEVERALFISLRNKISLTGSSRTDSGVHAYQNFFHFDADSPIAPTSIYSLNSLLPQDIAVKSITPVADAAHCRFDAISRQYNYHVCQQKDPFLRDRAWYYPYPVNIDILNEAAGLLTNHTEYIAFSKKRTGNTTTKCTITESNWNTTTNGLIYNVKANRFLRGMVRGLVATMLKVARGKSTMNDFRNILQVNTYSAADFSAPALGLFLVSVKYPHTIFNC